MRIEWWKMRILFIGISSESRPTSLEGILRRVIAAHKIEFTIANGENAAGGMALHLLLPLSFGSRGGCADVWKPYLGEEGDPAIFR